MLAALRQVLNVRNPPQPRTLRKIVGINMGELARRRRCTRARPNPRPLSPSAPTVPRPYPNRAPNTRQTRLERDVTEGGWVGACRPCESLTGSLNRLRGPDPVNHEVTIGAETCDLHGAEHVSAGALRGLWLRPARRGLCNLREGLCGG